jgi:hypothetical protein
LEVGRGIYEFDTNGISSADLLDGMLVLRGGLRRFGFANLRQFGAFESR